jgi:putative cell wall-binding protein
MQQKIALAQAKEARDRGNFDAAMRLNDKAQALGLQRYGLEVERAKAIDAIETGKTTRRLAEAKLQLIPAQLAALKAKAQLEGKNVVRPETYQKAYAALDSKFKTSLGNQIKDYLTKQQGSSYLQTERGQQEYNAIYNTKIRAAVLESLGLPPNTEVGSSYVRRSKAYDDDE